MVGILASVAAAHAVLAIALMTGGGCRQTKILAPHTYNNGPQVSDVPAAVDRPAGQNEVSEVPVVPGGDAPLTTPVAPVKPVRYDEPVTPVAPVAPVAPVSTGTKTYTVKKGDSLSKIAYKYGVRTRDLAACNNLSGKAVNMIRVGQVLTIPEGGVYNENRTPKNRGRKNVVKTKRPGKKKSAPKATATLPADGIYVVKSGDSLDRIGRRYGVSAKAIAKENNIALTKVLHIGDKLRIPGKAAAPAAAAEAKTAVPENVSSENINSNLLNDLDPNAGLDSAAGNSTAAENPAPAAGAAAAQAGDSAAAPASNSGASAPAATGKTESMEVLSDMTLDEFCKRNMVTVEEVRRLNPDLPADGKLKGGSFISIPSLD